MASGTYRVLTVGILERYHPRIVSTECVSISGPCCVPDSGSGEEGSGGTAGNDCAVGWSYTTAAGTPPPVADGPIFYSLQLNAFPPGTTVEARTCVSFNELTPGCEPCGIT